MCHNDKLNAFPEPGNHQRKEANGLKYWQYGSQSGDASRSVMVLTDIYGCNEFYQSFATYLANLGWQAQLVDLFTDLGELKEITREAAFERRHNLRDTQVCDQLQSHIVEQKLNAVIGFCLGGNYVMELARRNVPVNLVAYYAFPGGLPNQDGLQKPLEYLPQLKQSVTVLAGGSDDSAGRDNMLSLSECAQSNAAIDLHMYQESGHGFLTQLDSEDQTLRNNAEDSLAVCMQAIAQ